MKTFNKMVLAGLIIGVMMSCNQSAKKNNSENATIDTVEIMHMNKARLDETWVRTQHEMEVIRLRMDSIDEKDPDFNRKLDAEIVRFNADLDTLEYRFTQDNVEIDEELNMRYDSLRIKSTELKGKLKRWSDQTGENLEELESDIKTSFREFKESLKNENN